MRWTLVAIASLFASSRATNKCDDDLFCNGVSVELMNGECTPILDPCDDNDDSTEDSCDEKTKRCFHSLKDPDSPA
eukprot:12419972-Ditylum_brightwellii.AAC.1